MSHSVGFFSYSWESQTGLLGYRHHLLPLRIKTFLFIVYFFPRVFLPKEIFFLRGAFYNHILRSSKPKLVVGITADRNSVYRAKGKLTYSEIPRKSLNDILGRKASGELRQPSKCVSWPLLVFECLRINFGYLRYNLHLCFKFALVLHGNCTPFYPIRIECIISFLSTRIIFRGTFTKAR